VSAVNYNSDFNFSVVDAEDQVNDTRILTLPSKLSVGLGVVKLGKWLVGAQAVVEVLVVWLPYNQSADVSYEIYEIQCRWLLHCQNYNSFSSYAKRVVYRAGLKV
jgi:hypothetical protein